MHKKCWLRPRVQVYLTNRSALTRRKQKIKSSPFETVSQLSANSNIYDQTNLNDPLLNFAMNDPLLNFAMNQTNYMP